MSSSKLNMELEGSMIEAVHRETLWRCVECGHEEKASPLARRDGQSARWHSSPDHEPSLMMLVERERVYPSAGIKALLENMEVSDWGLAVQAIEHYKRNRQSAARRNPGADRVLARGVYPRFDGMIKAFGALRRESHPDTEDGGRIARV